MPKPMRAAFWSTFEAEAKAINPTWEELGRGADETSEEGKAIPAEATKGVPRAESTRISECNGSREATRGNSDNTLTRYHEAEPSDYTEANEECEDEANMRDRRRRTKDLGK